MTRQRLALIVGSDVGPEGARKLARWHWLRLPEGARAVTAAASLRPTVIIVKDAEQPVRTVADLRRVAEQSAVLVLARRYDEAEGRACIAAGAQCYGVARMLQHQDRIIAAALRALRRSGAPEAPPSLPAYGLLN